MVQASLSEVYRRRTSNVVRRCLVGRVSLGSNKCSRMNFHGSSVQLTCLSACGSAGDCGPTASPVRSLPNDLSGGSDREVCRQSLSLETSLLKNVDGEITSTFYRCRL